MVVHQTALYDMLWSFAILAILLLLSRQPRRTGFLFLTWAALYASGRIATDFARVDKHWFGLGLTGSQITSIIVLATCLVLLFRFKGAPDARTGTLLPEGAALIETNAVQEPLPLEDLPPVPHEPDDQHWGFEPEAAAPESIDDEQTDTDGAVSQDPLPFDLAPESPEPAVPDAAETAEPVTNLDEEIEGSRRTDHERTGKAGLEEST